MWGGGGGGAWGNRVASIALIGLGSLVPQRHREPAADYGGECLKDYWETFFKVLGTIIPRKLAKIISFFGLIIPKKLAKIMIFARAPQEQYRCESLP